MEHLTTTKRLELELETHQIAITIARAYGLAGIEYFCKRFPDISKEYAQAMKDENDNDITNLFSPPTV